MRVYVYVCVCGNTAPIISYRCSPWGNIIMIMGIHGEGGAVPWVRRMIYLQLRLSHY